MRSRRRCAATAAVPAPFRRRLRQNVLRARATPPRLAHSCAPVGTPRSAAQAAASARYALRGAQTQLRPASAHGQTHAFATLSDTAHPVAPAAEADAGEKRTAEEPAAEEPAAKAAKAEEAEAPAAEEAKPAADVAPVEAAAAEAEAPLKSGPVAVEDAPKGTPTPVIA